MSSVRASYFRSVEEIAETVDIGTKWRYEDRVALEDHSGVTSHGKGEWPRIYWENRTRISYENDSFAVERSRWAVWTNGRRKGAVFADGVRGVLETVFRNI